MITSELKNDISTVQTEIEILTWMCLWYHVKQTTAICGIGFMTLTVNGQNARSPDNCLQFSFLLLFILSTVFVASLLAKTNGSSLLKLAGILAHNLNSFRAKSQNNRPKSKRTTALFWNLAKSRNSVTAHPISVGLSSS